MFVKHVCPPYPPPPIAPLTSVTLTYWPQNQKGSSTCQDYTLPVCEVSWCLVKGFSIYWSETKYLSTTDGPAYRPTSSKQYTTVPSFFQRVEGGIKINLENNFMITVILVVMCRVSSVCRITCADPEAWTLTSQDVAKHNISQKPARTWSSPLYPSHTPAPLCAAMRICAVRNYTNYCQR